MTKSLSKKLASLSGERVIFKCDLVGEEWIKEGTIFCSEDNLVEFIYESKCGINGVFNRAIPRFHKINGVYKIPRCGPVYGINHYSSKLDNEDYKLRKEALDFSLN